LAFVRRGKQTILSRRRFTHPLHALEPVRACDGSLYLMMLNTSGGLVGGDRLRTTVEIGPEAAAILITASATKAYRTMGEAAVQETMIAMGRDSILEYLPDHLIPHPGAVVHQSLKVEMAAGSRAIIYDAFSAGRIGRGERWVFRELRTETAIVRGAQPLYINRSRIIPRFQPLTQLGWAQDFNYLATIVVVGEAARKWTSLSAEIDSALRECPRVHGGASEIGTGGSVVRFMTYRASDLIIATHTVWDIARRFLLGLGAFDLRKY
jgi:urease accessory protein